jgi:5-formyltetrahydrofolate cyclo-ligase
MAVFQAKRVLRKDLLSKLSRLTDAERQRQSSVVTRLLLDREEYKNSKRVSVFLSMPDEIITLPIVKDILDANKQCFIPRFEGPNMDMLRLYSIEDYNTLPETTRKIKQPSSSEERENALDTGGLDLILMPGLGFTRSGDRLGRGKGYYDNFLYQYKTILKHLPKTIALGFFEQICPTIPTTELDVPVDLVLFEDKDAK